MVILDKEEFEQIQQLVYQGYVNEQSHPKFSNLKIYTYSRLAEYQDAFKDIPLLRKCRGLVVDEDSLEVIIPCIPKFFNKDTDYTKDFQIKEDSQITLKEDGYLIQVRIHPKYGLIVTSKGSFNSRYANYVYMKIKTFIHDNGHNFFDENEAYICELCKDFPGDEGIIVTKHPEEKIVCWTIIDCKTGNEIDDLRKGLIPSLFEKVKFFTMSEMNEYLKQEVEGVVIRNIETNERMKYKTQWFFEQHKAISNCNERYVLKLLKEGKSIRDLTIPDEFIEQMKEWENNFLNQYSHILGVATGYYDTFRNSTDRQIASYRGNAIPCLYVHLIFCMRKLQFKRLSEEIWKFIEKKYKETHKDE